MCFVGKGFLEYSTAIFKSLQKLTHPLDCSGVWVMKVQSTTAEKSGLPQQCTDSTAHCPHRTEPAPAEQHEQKTARYAPAQCSDVPSCSSYGSFHSHVLQSRSLQSFTHLQADVNLSKKIHEFALFTDTLRSVRHTPPWAHCPPSVHTVQLGNQLSHGWWRCLFGFLRLS